MKLPPFNEDGILPPGDYTMTLEQIRESHLIQGLHAGGTWDRDWRLKLANNLEILANQLWAVGIEKIFVNGSFVEDKDHPNDIDGYFECSIDKLASGKLQHELNEIDPYKIWNWNPNSRSAAPGSTKKQLPMWHQYRVELYPHFGQGTGIKDKFGNELQFPSAFRMSRREQIEKGIILLVKSGERA